MNMIISKKHIILATLVVALGAAVFVNYRFNSDAENLAATSVAEETKSYGEAKFVDSPTKTKTSANPDDAETYFAEAKLTRTKSRDEAIDAMKTMLTDAALSTDQKATMTMKAADIAKSIETESKMENLIKAKGFADCMVYYDGETVDVMVKTTGLLDNEAAQIRDIIVSETGASAENISIVEVK